MSRPTPSPSPSTPAPSGPPDGPGAALSLPLNRWPPASPVWYPAGRGLTFLVDLVVQGDGATAPLDGPVRLLLRARVQGDALPLTSDAAFQLDSKDMLLLTGSARRQKPLPMTWTGREDGAHTCWCVRAPETRARACREKCLQRAPGEARSALPPPSAQELPAVGMGCAPLESRAPRPQSQPQPSPAAAGGPRAGRPSLPGSPA